MHEVSREVNDDYRHGKLIDLPRPPEYASRTRPFVGVDMVATG